MAPVCGSRGNTTHTRSSLVIQHFSTLHGGGCTVTLIRRWLRCRSALSFRVQIDSRRTLPKCRRTLYQGVRTLRTQDSSALYLWYRNVLLSVSLVPKCLNILQRGRSLDTSALYPNCLRSEVSVHPVPIVTLLLTCLIYLVCR